MRRGISLTTIGLLLGLGIGISVAAYTYRHLSSLDESEQWVSHTHVALETSQELVIAIGDAGRARRAFAITHDEAELGPYRAALVDLAASRRALRVLTADNPAQQARLDRIEPLIDARVAQLDAALRDARAHAFDPAREAELASAAATSTTRIGELVGEVAAEERRQLDARQAEQRDASASVKRAIVIGIGASGLILALAFLLSRREVRRRRRSEEALIERERRLAATLGSIGDAVIATDAAGVVTQMNPVAEALTGWSPADARGRPFDQVFRIIDQKTRAPSPDPVARVLRERVKVGLANHTALIARDGVERPIADSAAPIFGADGELQGVVIVFRDVTETHRVEARFQRLVEAAPDAIVIAGADGRITVTNEQAGALFGYAANELIGQPVELLLPERLRARHVEHRAEYQAAPAVRPMGAGLQLTAQRKDGSVCPVEVSLSPIDTAEGVQVIASVRDVRRRRELEQFRDEYVGYISHDLKNPLSVIVLQARWLAGSLDGRASADEQRAVGVIADSASFIDRLVRELLEMAYVESDQIEIQPEPVPLAPFLADVIERTVSPADRARVHVEIGVPAVVSAESRRLERVIVNVVQNAIKYAPAGSPIRVRQDVEGDRAVVSVTDEGPGLGPEERAYVFDKYRRTSTARPKEGLGLGLYISRKIVEAHGGEIGVDSAPGRGSTFFVRLPRIELAVTPSGNLPLLRSPAERLRGLKVLLVDDEIHALSALAALLDDEGLEVASATSGEQALAVAATTHPDVAVLDVQMPGMSGLALLDRLREGHPSIRAVIMSGHMASHAGIALARETTGASYIAKPVDVDELLRTLARLAEPAAPPSSS